MGGLSGQRERHPGQVLDHAVMKIASDASPLRLRSFDRFLEQFLAFLLMRGALLLVGVHATSEDDEDSRAAG